jgi:hypothetical protein
MNMADKAGSRSLRIYFKSETCTPRFRQGNNDRVLAQAK